MCLIVTPYEGVWIETFVPVSKYCCTESHPTWVCGLKLVKTIQIRCVLRVTPYVGVWIETIAEDEPS